MTARESDPLGCLEAALRYAAHGWPCGPSWPGRKNPIPSNGLLGATTNADLLSAWWRKYPEANVFIRTGGPGPDIVDLDLYRDRDAGLAAFRKLRDAGLLAGAFALIRTRAGGLHAYFAGTDQRNAAGLDPARTVDFRASGGLVVAPPSYVQADDKGPAGRYELLEKRPYTGAAFDLAAARQLLEPPKCRSHSRRSGQSDGKPGTWDAAKLTAWVAAQNQPGDRHGPLHWAARRLAEAGQLDDDASDLLIQAALEAGLSGGEREARSVIRSVGGPA